MRSGGKQKRVAWNRGKTFYQTKTQLSPSVTSLVRDLYRNGWSFRRIHKKLGITGGQFNRALDGIPRRTVEESCALMSQSHLGVKLLEHHADAIRISRPGASKKISTGLKRFYSNGGTSWNLGLHHSERTKNRLRLARYAQKNVAFGVKTKNQIEGVISASLRRLGVRFRYGHPIPGEGPGAHKIDFFLIDYSVALEYDGCYHHFCDLCYAGQPSEYQRRNVARDRVVNSVYRRLHKSGTLTPLRLRGCEVDRAIKRDRLDKYIESRIRRVVRW